MKEYYFTVAGYVSDNGELVFRQDPDTLDARFPDGSVYDTDTDTWSRDTTVALYNALSVLIGADPADGVGPLGKSYYNLLTLLSGVAPLATISEDSDGQIVIHTNLTEVGGVLQDMDS